MHGARENEVVWARLLFLVQGYFSFQNNDFLMEVAATPREYSSSRNFYYDDEIADSAWRYDSTSIPTATSPPSRRRCTGARRAVHDGAAVAEA